MDDYISRQAAIDAVRDRMGKGETKIWDTFIECFEMILNALPSAQPYTDEEIQKMQDLEQAELDKAFELGKQAAEPQWIPCSERLPEEEQKEYWVCTDTGYQCQCRWTDVNHFWTGLTTDWHWHWMDIPQYTKVVAWRELPEPWRGEEP